MKRAIQIFMRLLYA